MATGLAGRRFLILALACGGFGIGVSEYLVMGLLPQIAADLLPELSRSNHDAALAATGGLASAYALGVVVGMFATPMLTRRLSERGALLVCAGGMLVFTLLTAFAPTLTIAIVLRFLSALAHASYLGVGAMAVAHLLGGSNYGRGAAIVHGGLAAANLVGVPVLTALGAGGEWRLILGGVTLFFAVPFIALLMVRLPDTPVTASVQLGGGVRKRRLSLLISAAVLSAAGAFVIVTYIAPVVVAARSADVWLTTGFAMFAFGVGMNLGNLASGWLADRRPGLAFCGAALAGAAGAAILLVPAVGGAFVAVAVLLIGVCLGGVSPSGQVLYMRELRKYPRLASSLPSGAGNLGSFGGALVGGAILAGSGVAWLPAGALVLIAVALLCFAAYRLRRVG